MEFRARAATPWLRLVRQALLVIAWLNLLELGARIALDTLSGSERGPLPLLVRRAFFCSALPALVAEAIGFACAARLSSELHSLLIALPGRTLEVSRASIASLRLLRPPWLRLVLSSGEVVPLDLAPRDPVAFAAALGLAAPPRIRRFLALRFIAAPLVLIAILFNLHQHIAYGGLLGEWRLVSPARWLHTLAGVTLAVYVHALAFAAWLRLAIEMLALFLPRRLLEPGAAILYLLGIAALLVLRLSA